MRHIVAERQTNVWRVIQSNVNCPTEWAVNFARARLNASGHGAETVALEVTEDFDVGEWIEPARMHEIVAVNKVLGSFPAVMGV